jgi:hypothetical protein
MAVYGPGLLIAATPLAQGGPSPARQEQRSAQSERRVSAVQRVTPIARLCLRAGTEPGDHGTTSDGTG